jgi:predicted SnoaL-like aldol condensation-catalyzing enzyme
MLGHGRPIARKVIMNFIHRPRLGIAAVSTFALVACATSPQPSHEKPSVSNYKQQVVELLKSIETGDSKPLAYINPNKYVQHNLAAGDGLAGVKALLQSLPKGSAKANTVRVFQDGNFVFAHTDYNFFGPKVGFDIFRFEDGKIVEHWDNLQQTAAKPSPSGRTMIDGPTTASDLDQTDANKALIQTYMDDLLQGRREKFAGYFDGNNYIQHNPLVADNLTGLFAGLQALAKQGLQVKYDRVHKILGDGNFVLVVAEGSFGDHPSSYYDLYRIQDGKIAEHWDTIEPIPPRAEWKNSNGKFFSRAPKMESDMTNTIENTNKALVLEAFDTLFNKRDYVAAGKFWSPDYIQHSAHIPPGRDGLFNLVKGAPAAMRYENSLIMAEGDMLMLHGRFTNVGQPAAWIVLDIVRIENGRLAEHWDVIEDEATRAASLSGLPMFGKKFPD